MVNLDELLESYSKDGNNDRDLLISILKAKQAEDEYHTAIINARTEYSKSIRLQYKCQQFNNTNNKHPNTPPYSPNSAESSRQSSPSEYNREDVINALKHKLLSSQ